MKTIAHISDPHFGTENPEVARALLAELDGSARPAPSLVVISGDLTQRALFPQFQAARAFLDRLPGPYLVVPGNHDVPLHAPLERLWRPLARYRACITEDLAPTYRDDELAVAGIDTAHGFTVKGGRITGAQTETACAQLGASPARWRVLVAHHPFVVPFGVSRSDELTGAAEALPRLEACGLDVILTGHLHVHVILGDDAGFRTDDRRVVSVHAGTCMSTRLRGEPNGYNWLTFEGEEVTIVHRVWGGSAFGDGASKCYRRRAAPDHTTTFAKLG